MTILAPFVLLLGLSRGLQDNDQLPDPGTPRDPAAAILVDAPQDFKKLTPEEQQFWMGRVRAGITNPQTRPALRAKFAAQVATWGAQSGQHDQARGDWEVVLQTPDAPSYLRYQALQGVLEALKNVGAAAEEVASAQERAKAYLDSGWIPTGSADTVRLNHERYSFYTGLTNAAITAGDSALAASYRLAMIDSGEERDLPAAYRDAASLFLAAGMNNMASTYIKKAIATTERMGAPSFDLELQALYAQYGLVKVLDGPGTQKKLRFGEGDLNDPSSPFFAGAEDLLTRFGAGSNAQAFEGVLAHYYVKSGQFDKAALHYRNQLRRNPKDPMIWGNLLAAIGDRPHEGRDEEEYRVSLEAQAALGAKFWEDENLRRNFEDLRKKLEGQGKSRLAALDQKGASGDPELPASGGIGPRALAGAGILALLGVVWWWRRSASR